MFRGCYLCSMMLENTLKSILERINIWCKAEVQIQGFHTTLKSHYINCAKIKAFSVSQKALNCIQTGIILHFMENINTAELLFHIICPKILHIIFCTQMGFCVQFAFEYQIFPSFLISIECLYPYLQLKSYSDLEHVCRIKPLNLGLCSFRTKFQLMTSYYSNYRQLSVKFKCKKNIMYNQT